MIDRAARDQYSRNLRLLVAGSITNDQFERDTPARDVDAAIMAFTDMAWLLCSDMKEHRLVGRHIIQPSDRREVLRWIYFWTVIWSTAGQGYLFLASHPSDVLDQL